MNGDNGDAGRGKDAASASIAVTTFARHPNGVRNAGQLLRRFELRRREHRNRVRVAPLIRQPTDVILPDRPQRVRVAVDVLQTPIARVDRFVPPGRANVQIARNPYGRRKFLARGAPAVRSMPSFRSKAAVPPDSCRGRIEPYRGTGTWYRGTGTWYRGTGTWYRGTGTWYRGTGTWYRGTGTWYFGTGTWYFGTGTGYFGTGTWYRGTIASYFGRSRREPTRAHSTRGWTAPNACATPRRARDRGVHETKHIPNTAPRSREHSWGCLDDLSDVRCSRNVTTRGICSSARGSKE
jgi:hypothetical protein